MKKHILFFILLITSSVVFSQASRQTIWVDSVLQNMTLDEKLGQLFIIRSFAKKEEEQSIKILSLIKDFHIGGVCFFKGTVPAMVDLINRYQSLSRWPLLMSMDAEWGMGMRLTDLLSFPKQITLGAMENNQLIYQMAREMAAQMKDLGIHMNFAPVLDINNNICNPVINERSFSSNRKKVIAKSFAYMQGLQDGGVLSCLKHFPGHGDTEIDSHADLPTINCSKQRLDSIELYPFKAIIDLHPASVMVAHLNIPALDSTKDNPATLSSAIVKSLLRTEYNYDGLIITDALEMKGVTRKFTAAEIALKAFQAGNDLLLLSEDIPAALIALKNALYSGEITVTQLDEKVKRILMAKYHAGLSNFQPIQIDSNWIKRSNLRSQSIKQDIYKKAFTLARDKNNLVPVRNIPSKIVHLNINGDPDNGFQKRIKDYADLTTFSFSNSDHWNPQLNPVLEDADLILISLHKLNYSESRYYGLNEEFIQELNPLIAGKKCIITVFGCPYVSMLFPKSCSLFLAYEDNEISMDLAAQMLFGTDPIAGSSPVDVYDLLQEGSGIQLPALMRLGYSNPESQGMNSDSLQKIDSLATELIQHQAAPGCQIVVVKNNHIVFRKAYGFFTYDSITPVTDHSMYDLASLTKIVCTAPVLMKLFDEHKYEVEDKFANYFPEFGNSNKSDLTLKDFMLHQGKLVAWIPFYKSTLISPDTLNVLDHSYYGKVPSFRFNIPVSDSLYLRSDYRDTIFQKILDSKLLDEKKYLYSDIGFYFMPRFVQQLTQQGFEPYFNKNFVKPLSLRYTAFNPLSKQYSKNQIAPTEVDNYYRHRVIQGYVHDMGAAMLGGISGHAGLFSTATDVATIMQMILNHGTYGDVTYFNANTFSKFTTRDPELSRRALIFDMPELIDSSTAYVSPLASKKTFGHQGFTGTCTWVDPEHKLIYVFLSNRTYPDSKINLLHKNRYRRKIQEVIYKSIMNEKQEVD